MREPTCYILAALLDGPMHGDREEIVEGRTRRYYRLTDLGRQALLAEAARMQQAASVVIRRLATPVEGPA
jgi:hypothetical protein